MESLKEVPKINCLKNIKQITSKWKSVIKKGITYINYELLNPYCSFQIIIDILKDKDIDSFDFICDFDHRFDELKKLLIPIIALLVITVPIAVADEDDYEDEYEDDDREGYGVMEREREREREHDDDDNELAIGSGMGDMILYATIAAIAASVAYTGLKMLKTKKPLRSRV